VPPNPSLKAPTRYGSHRLAAPGLSEYHPSAASRRLPPPVGLARTLGSTQTTMSRTRRAEPFFLIIAHRTYGKFNVIGPMTDDTSWIDRTLAAQGQGESVNCHSTGCEQTLGEVIARFARESGLEHSESVLI
jgi:hypothetical protein